MNKTLTFFILVILVVGGYFLFVRPQGVTTRVTIGEPQYADLEDFKQRGAPADRFSLTSWGIDGNIITISCYTYGKPDEEKLFDEYLKKMTHLTAKLRPGYQVNLVLYDGNPDMTINDKPVGTGQILRTVALGN